MVIPIVVFHGGIWNEKRYVNYKTAGVLVDDIMGFEDFVGLIVKEIRLDASISSIELSTLLDFGMNKVQNIVEIHEDKDVAWFLTLVKEQSTRHPLVAHVTSMCLEGSSSVVSSEAENYLSIVPYSMPMIDDDFQVIMDIHIARDLKEKDVFASKEILSKCFYYIAVKKNFEFKTLRSNSRSIEFRCVQDGCQWYVRASRYKASDLWMLRKFIDIHDCSMNNVQTSHRQASASLIGDCLKNEFRSSSSDSLTPKDIVNKVRKELGVNISYYKAWRAKEHIMKSLKGDACESYALIPKFLMKLEELNPGTFTAYETDIDGHFKYCYMAIGSSIEGWKHCRPNIFVDGTFLKCKYAGTLLTASTVDGNNENFPLAFSIVDSENDASWKWFFENIKNSFGEREGLVIISNRHLSIPQGIMSVCPTAEYCICIRHLLQNMKTTYKDSLIDKIFYSCAEAYTIDNFELNMKWMESIYPSIREYLSEVGFEKWARAYSRRKRYRMMTTNISESLSSVLEESREFPIASLLDSIRQLLQDWFYERSKLASSMKTVLTSWAENELRDQHNQSRNFKVDSINNEEYKVVDGDNHYVVNVISKSCSCCFWDLEEIPCAHACAVLSELNLDSYAFVSDYYFSNTFSSTYKRSIHPIGNHSDWSSVDVDGNVLPPIVKRQVGRPRKQRILSMGEERSHMKCS
ncbi:uncharacterized protein LOC120092945 [Benincasa hispida]|uniref:uncharacterized protein LOC120092945 n=1 Tax=Benincasa hispida TaxID=102211 RepID=UPI0019001A68|nr:uncharacterized protein LOC120092945 [Benincasa hispida]